MNYAQEDYMQLVEQAYDGRLQLPAFQRDWKWERNKVIALFDSIRKGFPIGGLLILKCHPGVNLAPRHFSGCKDLAQEPERLVLDGQQRITSGIALKYGLGGSLRYFLNIEALEKLYGDKGIDLDSDEAVLAYAQEIDDGDNYLIGSTKAGEELSFVYENHLVDTRLLTDKGRFDRAMEEYEERYPEKKQFLRRVVYRHFTLPAFSCPVTGLTEQESITAVTRIFATLNTTGKRLTPIEIVTAILFSGDVDLKDQIREFKEASYYLSNMDQNGEVLLQTIAMLAGKTPKKALLPKTIDIDTFKDYYQEAFDLLDALGEFMSVELGVGFTDTNKLLPYDSILAPMAIVYKEVKRLRGRDRVKAEDKLKRWFVGSALDQRYQEGVHNKQSTDKREMLRWIQEGDEAEPKWLRDVCVPLRLKSDSPSGARGRLIRCLLNREHPKDPIDRVKVGYYGDADQNSQDHHIWAKKFCRDHLVGWADVNDSCDVILNLIPISAKTNKKWDKMNPSDQIADSRNSLNPQQQQDIYRSLWLPDQCLTIMEKPDKTKADFDAFIDARYQYAREKLAEFGFDNEAAEDSSEDAY